jgi:hypothetical protein
MPGRVAAPPSTTSQPRRGALPTAGTIRRHDDEQPCNRHSVELVETGTPRARAAASRATWKDTLSVAPRVGQAEQEVTRPSPG